jgi:hypothetical protein
MFQNYHDGLANCKVYGPPDFFITFTCNPGWPEIIESFLSLVTTDRSDIIVRVFHLKLDDILDDIRSGKIFGPFITGNFFMVSFLFFFVHKKLKKSIIT